MKRFNSFEKETIWYLRGYIGGKLISYFKKQGYDELESISLIKSNEISLTNNGFVFN